MIAQSKTNWREWPPSDKQKLLTRLQAQSRTSQAAITRPEFRGAALAIQSLRAPEWVISGPAETGKTFAALYLLDTLAREYKGSQWAIIRKVRHDMDGTVLQTFEKRIMRPDVQIYGGSKAERYIYPNGSVIWVGGMDRPGSVLSGERDGIYINQAEEMLLEDWETCTTRTTGRAGNVPFGGMTFGDCNPGAATHWLLHRESLTMLHSRHEDNPMLFSGAGKLTEQGGRSLATLDNLTGVRKERLRFGRWVSAEGTVYQFDPALHEVDPFPIPEGARLIRSIDFGFVNPFTCQWWYIDGDGRMYLYREIYMTKRTVRVHAQQINALSQGETYEVTITDHDAEDRATLEENGIYSAAADKDITTGIEKVQERLKAQGDGKPRLFVMRGALVERDEELAALRKPVCLRDEFDVYLWPKAADGKPVKDVPVKMFDHALDPTRYAAKYLDNFPAWIIHGVV